jgi:predicted GH43/DUF377 family glycosyl hydrolase
MSVSGADFVLERDDEMSFASGPELAGMYKLSPYVWPDRGDYALLLRVVNADRDGTKKVARIHAGGSRDGVRFVLEDEAVIAPSEEASDADSGGCEDPTLAFVAGRYYVYYTGWNQHRKVGTLLLATGTKLSCLAKRGVALPSTDAVRNPKEATIVRASDGRWLLFFEFARDDRSRIGVAEAGTVEGPWRVLPVPFESRHGAWDAWHLSPGPIVETARGPVMFYNGATADAAWRVGWVRFDPGYRRVVARSGSPLLAPGDRRAAEDTDIAFAASALVERGLIRLYYSTADRYCRRATVGNAQGAAAEP